MTLKSQNIKRYAGLDLAKESIFACVVDNTGLKLDERFETDLKSLIELKNWLIKHNVGTIAMENTGIYTEPVQNLLSGYFQLEIVNAADTKRTNQKKTDQDDAWWLAELLMAGTIGKDRRIRSSTLTSKKEQEFKKLTRLRTTYVNHLTKQKNRIHKIFDRNGCKITSLFGDNKFTKTALMVYSALAQNINWETKIVHLKTEIANLNGIEKGNRTRALKFIQKHQNELERITIEIVTGKLSRVDQISLMMNLQLLEQFSDYVTILEREIKESIEENSALKENIERTQTIPGIGEATAAIINSEIPDINNFFTGEEFASFAGLVPSVSQSAEVTHLGHITKRGSPYLRQAFYQAAKVASMNKKTAIGMKADRLFKRKGKGKGKIVWVAIARHLAVVTWVLLTRNIEYQDKNFCKKQYKRKNRLLQKTTIDEILTELQRRNYSITS